MQASRLRERILNDHEQLRGLLDQVERQALQVGEGVEQGAEALRALGLRLLAQFGEHLALEDRLLAPLLRGAGATGRMRAEELDADHREQRELLDYLLGKVRDPSRPDAVLAAEWRSFVALLRDDMAREERALLEERRWQELVPAKPASAGSLGPRSIDP